MPPKRLPNCFCIFDDKVCPICGLDALKRAERLEFDNAELRAEIARLQDPTTAVTTPDGKFRVGITIVIRPID